MLYPQENRCRSVHDLSGIWDIKIDKNQEGEKKSWFKGFIPEAPIGIPGSWNEQLAELGLMHYIGPVWLQTKFFIPSVLKERTHLLQFGSADYSAKIWVNGKFVGGHEGGFLPFEFAISSLLDYQKENILIVEIDNTLTHDTIPQGLTKEEYQKSNRKREQTYPSTTFDFLPYGGLPRPVNLISLETCHFKSIKVETTKDKTSGKIRLHVDLNKKDKDHKVVVRLFNVSKNIFISELKPTSGHLECEIKIKDCQFWEPGSPFLYKMHLELLAADQLVDEYDMKVGVREVTVKNNQLLLNGKPVFLRGFGKHEDFDVIGKGLSYPLLVKDFELMKWIGANSFRTSHYPYAEEVLHLADRYGFLIINEVPAVSLNFKYVTKKTLANHKKSIRELIARDRNHPCVISWCLGNEPGIMGEKESNSKKADTYWKDIFSFTRQIDKSRPCTVPAFPLWAENDLVFKYSDFISLNRYWGWYEIPAELEKAAEKLNDELSSIYKKYKKPILLTEFGVDTIEGEHATYPQMFTEEFQTSFIETYFQVIENLKFTIGEHIWNFADFQTAQNYRRVVLNKKGVFNRQRQPKSAAFAIRQHWRNLIP